MILVDTSVIASWIDPEHPQDDACERALLHWANEEELAISAVTYSEFAAAGRTKEALDEVLGGFRRIDFDFEAAFRAGQAFGRWNPEIEANGRPVSLGFEENDPVRTMLH